MIGGGPAPPSPCLPAVMGAPSAIAIGTKKRLAMQCSRPGDGVWVGMMGEGSEWKEGEAAAGMWEPNAGAAACCLSVPFKRCLPQR